MSVLIATEHKLSRPGGSVRLISVPDISSPLATIVDHGRFLLSSLTPPGDSAVEEASPLLDLRRAINTLRNLLIPARPDSIS